MLRGWCLGVVVWVGVWGEARRGSRGGRRGGRVALATDNHRGLAGSWLCVIHVKKRCHGTAACCCWLRIERPTAPELLELVYMMQCTTTPATS